MMVHGIEREPTTVPPTENTERRVLVKYVVFLLIAWPAYWMLGTTGASLWRWFVLPVFRAAPSLSPAQAAGLWLVLRFVRGFGLEAGSKKPEPVNAFAASLILSGVIGPAIALFFGWAIKAVWL